MRVRAFFLLPAFVGLAVSCDGSTDIEARYSATLNGASEVPAVTTSGFGTFQMTLNDDNILSYTLEFSGLGSNSTQAHFHGPASTTQNANILVDLNAAASGRTITLGSTSGTASGTIDLNVDISTTLTAAAFRQMLDLGQLYVNVHTQQRSGGEIRGQIVRQ